MVGREPHPEKLSWIYKTGFSGSLILTVGTFILAYTTKSPELGDFLSKLLGPFFALVSSGWTADLSIGRLHFEAGPPTVGVDWFASSARHTRFPRVAGRVLQAPISVN